MTTLMVPSHKTSEDAAAAARRWCRREHRGFYYACAFLPPAKRDAAYALRAFIELIERAILTSMEDEAAPAPPASVGISCCGSSALDQRVAMVRRRIDDLYAGELELPLAEFRSPGQQILVAADLAIQWYEVPRQCWEALIDGCAAEVRTARFATRASLERFLRQRAGSVGRVMASVFGATHSDAAFHAEELAIAMRFADLLGRLARDWRRGKLYIPLEDLARCGYSERDLDRGVVNDRFRQLIAGQIEQTRERFRNGAEAIAWLADDGSRLTAATLAVVSASRLRAIEWSRYEILREVPEIPWFRRAGDLLAAWRLGRRRVGEPLPAVF